MRAMLSIGGWTGSRFFSSAVATDANRTAFAEAVMAVISEYKLDGVDFEYALLALSFIALFTHRSIAGNTPANQGLVATSHPQMTAPIISNSCEPFVARKAERI
jgi:hypothetical protein